MNDARREVSSARPEYVCKGRLWGLDDVDHAFTAANHCFTLPRSMLNYNILAVASVEDPLGRPQQHVIHATVAFSHTPPHRDRRPPGPKKSIVFSVSCVCRLGAGDIRAGAVLCARGSQTRLLFQYHGPVSKLTYNRSQTPKGNNPAQLLQQQ